MKAALDEQVTATVAGTRLCWMHPRDIYEVLDIEADSFEFPWSGESFFRCTAHCMGQHHLPWADDIGMVAKYEDQVFGYMVYELEETQLKVINFAVKRKYRRLGVGHQMIAGLITMLRPKSRRISLKVREKNLSAQLFFRAEGFRAVSVLRDYYRDTDEDAYVMEYSLSA